MHTKFLSRSGAIGRTRLGTAVVGAALAAALVGGSEVTAAAQSPASQATPAAARAKKYRASAPIVVDKLTGQRRLPTEQEVDSLVATLSQLTTQVAVSGAGASGRSMRLESGYEGVVIGRANEDGTVETRCVYSFDEGAAFLGLVAVEVQ